MGRVPILLILTAAKNPPHPEFQTPEAKVQEIIRDIAANPPDAHQKDPGFAP